MNSLIKHKYGTVTHVRIIAILLLVICILMTIILTITQLTIGSNISDTNLHTIQLKEREFEKILVSNRELQRESRYKINDIKNKCYKEIINSYSDINVLKEELNKKEYANIDKVITPLIRKEYLNDVTVDSNGIIVTTQESIICDYSYKDALDKSDDKNYNSKQWSDFINNSKSPEITKVAVDAIKNRVNDKFIFYFTNDAKYVTENMEIDELREIVYEHGIEALKGVVFMVPSYITDEGDLFGEVDIKFGIKRTTDKIIFIQTYNVYDQIMAAYPELFDESYMNAVEYNISKSTQIFGILSVVVKVCALAIIIFIMYLFNLFITNIHKNSKDIQDFCCNNREN